MDTLAKRTQSDYLDPARAAALHATLGHTGPLPKTGQALPSFWHYIYFWDALQSYQLGRDGHPLPGGFLPDTGLPRRMWAGGQLEFLAPLLLGDPAEKRSEIKSVTHKTGRTGPLALVTVEHEFHQNGHECIRERQDLIYRQDPDPDAPKPTSKLAPNDEDESQQVFFDSTLLFRYSALTFNGHRIHYDRDYSRHIEGYPGLVVHGPLLAQLLLHMAESILGAVRSFTFRATAPLFDFETADICAKNEDGGLALWVRGPDGRECTVAQAR
ncbi:MAG: 3-methylfumaryl-CoA hydratase [Planctomycetota bacterium]|jgi:3-methylfumaryl-CoA hydratase